MINADIKLDEFNENDKKAIDSIYKKYELLLDDTIEVDGKTLYRIRSTSEFVSNNLCHVYVGSLGGYVESRSNLSDGGTCWITYDSKVYGDAIIRDNALIVKSNINGNAECLSSNIGLNSIVQDSTLVGYFEVFDSTIINSNITSSYIDDSRVSRSTVKNATVQSSLITDAFVDGEEDNDHDVLTSARSVIISKSEVYGIVEDSNGKVARCSISFTIKKAESLFSKVAVGDYVDYDPGKWTETRTEKAEDGYYWGMKSGTSKSTGVRCNSADSSTRSGWMVLGKTNGQVLLISAGTPECIYHPGKALHKGI